MNKFWKQVEAKFQADALKSITRKLTIDDGHRDHDLYVKIAFYHGRPVWVEITLSRMLASDNGTHTETAKENQVYRRMIESARSSMEVICLHASLLLQSKRSTLKDLEEMWAATRFEPAGTCKNLEGEVAVLSPLDAVAKLIRLRITKWEKEMAYTPTEEEIETMIEACVEAAESTPEVFTAWEISFLEDIQEKNELGHLSDKEIAKLEEIHEERVGG